MNDDEQEFCLSGVSPGFNVCTLLYVALFEAWRNGKSL